MKWKSKGEHENPEVGSWMARLVWLIDLGTQMHTFPGQDPRESRDVRLGFELPDQRMKGIYDPKVKGKPFMVSIDPKQSMHPKSTLYKIITGWRGKAMSREELEAFDPKTLLGQGCRLSLIENEKGYINIESVSKLTPEEKKKLGKQVNASMFFSLEEGDMPKGEFEKAFAKLPDFLKEKIAASPEFKKIMGMPVSDDSQPDASEGEQGGGEGNPF